MVPYVELFKSRMRFDGKQQPSWQPVLTELKVWMDAEPPHHPYELSDSSLSKLDKISSICGGHPASLETSNYLYYRIVNINTVITPKNSIYPYNTNGPDENWNILENDYEDASSWPLLSNYITGVLPGRRGFTWWTPAPVWRRPTLPSAHQIGLINDWLSRPLLVLRIDARKLDLSRLAKVPTVFDGFGGPVFCAQGPDAPIGKTIDISNPADPQEGHPEFVVGTIEAEQVSLRPIAVDPNERRKYPVDAEAVIAPLIQFHNARS